MHTLSTGTSDGPETVMEADEYLQPQFQRPVLLRGHQSSSTSSSPPVTPTLKQSADSSIPQNQHNWDRELLRYAHSHNAQSNGVPSRYCSDPLRIGKGRLKLLDQLLTWTSGACNNPLKFHVTFRHGRGRRVLRQ